MGALKKVGGGAGWVARPAKRVNQTSDVVVEAPL